MGKMEVRTSNNQSPKWVHFQSLFTRYSNPMLQGLLWAVDNYMYLFTWWSSLLLCKPNSCHHITKTSLCHVLD
jgi:hypothetical protein